jgi:hypothetical protein
MQIHDGEGEVFRECAIVIDDSEYTSARAMSRDSRAAITARLSNPLPGAGYVGFPDDPLPDPACILTAGDAFDFANKFVTERAMKIAVPAQDFDVGIADSGQAHANERPPSPK